MMYLLDRDRAATFARLTLGHLSREWPYKPNLILTGPQDLALPKEQHRIFHGSFDWHSCVHGWWQVMRLARLFPDMPEAQLIEARADAMLVPKNVAGELGFFSRPLTHGFERPYGWAWLLALHHELSLRPECDWAQTLEPLAREIAARFRTYLPKLLYPIRSGMHDCTAFSLVLALEWARSHDEPLACLIRERALEWFGSDRNARPWEPGGEDFLSATLCEAVLMRDVLDQDHFSRWFGEFLPELLGENVACLRTPAPVTDRTDGRLAHLDGLNLSRSWCWRRLCSAVSQRSAVIRIADDHLAASLPHLSDDYMGEHWLATFALLALCEGEAQADADAGQL